AELESRFERLWPAAEPLADGRAVPLRVVLADDRPELRALIRIALELNGNFQIVGEAGDGSDAIKAARLHQPDLVLLDVLMPRMGGLQALPHITAVAPHSKVVILTAVDTESLRGEEATEAAAVFGKTIGPARLAEQLVSLFG